MRSEAAGTLDEISRSGPVQEDTMLKARRCYCDRLYAGFQCAYCRLADVLAEEEQPDPRAGSSGSRCADRSALPMAKPSAAVASTVYPRSCNDRMVIALSGLAPMFT
jgi:hypothetical protein